MHLKLTPAMDPNPNPRGGPGLGKEEVIFWVENALCRLFWQTFNTGVAFVGSTSIVDFLNK
jgi:hypothetical protein